MGGVEPAEGGLGTPRLGPEVIPAASVLSSPPRQRREKVPTAVLRGVKELGGGKGGDFGPLSSDPFRCPSNQVGGMESRRDFYPPVSNPSEGIYEIAV